MNTTINKRKNTFSKNDIYPLIEGVDFFINLALVTYLCAYFLPEIELRLSILIVTSFALFSYFSKLFIFKISTFVKKKIERTNEPSELNTTILNGDIPLDLSTLRLPSSCDKPIDIIKPNKQEPSKKTKALSGADKKENFRASMKL